MAHAAVDALLAAFSGAWHAPNEPDDLDLEHTRVVFPQLAAVR